MKAVLLEPFGLWDWLAGEPRAFNYPKGFLLRFWPTKMKAPLAREKDEIIIE